MLRENAVLEEKQATEYDDKVSEYVFTCEGAGVKTKPSPVLVSKKAGIRLHFMRYGLFRRDDESILDVTAPRGEGAQKKHVATSKEAEVIALKDAPSLDNFYVGRTALNRGYVYIIVENDPDLWYEYEVDELGLFSPVFWADNKDKNGHYKDIRKASGKKEKDKIFKNGTILWITYSQVQWTIDYHTQMRTDEEKRKERMLRVECTGFEKGGDNPHEYAIPYDEVTGTYISAHRPQSLWLDDKLKEIAADETAPDPKNENTIKEDMFITLHDPIGCADDIAEYLKIEIFRHRAKIESLQTGEEEQVVFDRLIAGKEPGVLSEEQEQIGAMFSLALTSYQLVYNNEEMIDDYDGGDIGGFWRNGIHKEKLINVLGVEERKGQRRKVRALRDDFGKFLQGKYYQNAYFHHFGGSELNKVDGKYYAMQHFSLLAIKPHIFDRSIDLKDEYEKDKKWDNLIGESLRDDTDSPLYNVMNVQVDIKEYAIEHDVDLSNKFASFVTTSMDTYCYHAVHDVTRYTTVTDPTVKTVKSNYELMVKRLNTIKVYGDEVFEVRGFEVRKSLPANMAIDESGINPGKYLGKKDLMRWKVDSPALVLKETAHGKHIFDVPVLKTEVVKVTETIETVDRELTKAGAKVKKVLDGVPFRGVVALLQVFNIQAAYKLYSSDGGLKSRINLAGIGAEFIAASLNLTKSLLKKSLQESLVKRMEKIAICGEAVGGGVTVIMCGWEAFESHSARDNDAMWAWAGAGAAFSVSTVATIMGAGSVIGPFGWVAAGIGVGLVALAYYFKDTPLETFFKHYAFSDMVAFPKRKGELTWQYNKRFYQARKQLMGKDNAYMKWTDFLVAGAELTDLIVCCNIRLEAGEPVNVNAKNRVRGDIHFYNHPSRNQVIAKVTSGYISEFKAKIWFRQFLQSGDQVRYEVYYFAEGIKNGNPENLHIREDVLAYEGTDSEPSKAVVLLKMPERILRDRKKSQILFVCRLDIGEGKYYPTPLNDNMRYLGIISNLLSTTIETPERGLPPHKRTVLYQSNVKIDTLDNLLSNKLWQ
ncbi:hypothetical protein DMA11_21520 [Marinilabiliaceae bacterium JC017]|nr:hypothetical protein DMA11_21520 [Marinilabiliaceae bacterium JC017]